MTKAEFVSEQIRNDYLAGLTSAEDLLSSIETLLDMLSNSQLEYFAKTEGYETDRSLVEDE